MPTYTFPVVNGKVNIQTKNVFEIVFVDPILHLYNSWVTWYDDKQMEDKNNNYLVEEFNNCVAILRNIENPQIQDELTQLLNNTPNKYDTVAIIARYNKPEYLDKCPHIQRIIQFAIFRNENTPLSIPKVATEYLVVK
jgi:hypothetical protein